MTSEKKEAGSTQKYEKVSIEIFGLSGKMSTGKDYIAQRVLSAILPERKTIFLAFANHFKIDAIVKANLDRNKVFGKKDDYTRSTLQRLGTEEGRDKYGENIWINLCYEWLLYYQSIGYERVFIMDVRFPNEVEFLHQIGGKVVRVEAPERNSAAIVRECQDNIFAVKAIKEHSSETSLDNCKDFDLVVKNDFNDNPFVQIRDFVRAYTEETKLKTVFLVDVDDTIGECHVYYEDTINKVERLAIDFAEKNSYNVSNIKREFREYIGKMRDRVNTSVFIHTRFSNDLAWAITNTINKFNREAPETIELAKEAQRLGMAVYDYPYHPLPGAVEALRKLTTIGKVVLFTLGDRIEQAKKIASLGISDLPFEVTHDKCKTTFEGLKRKHPATTHIMIGDSMCRDIQPALAAGFDYCYWVNPKYIGATYPEDIDENFDEVTSLAEAVEQIEANEEVKRLKDLYYQPLSILQEADKVNRNGRIYPEEVLKRESLKITSQIDGHWDISTEPPTWLGFSENATTKTD